MKNTELSRKLFSISLKLISFLLFISLFYIAYSQEKKLDNYKVKNGSYSNNIKITYSSPSNVFKSSKKNNNIESFIGCYEKSMDEEDFTDEMKNTLDKLYVLFSDNKYVLSFAYEDMYSGLHISYNENQEYFAASTIKAPVILYTYELAETNGINLDSYITYTPDFFVEGSGSLQYTDFGASYTIRELSKKSIIESDNIAYQMVAAAVSGNNIESFWKEKGANIFWKNGIWGNDTAYDFSIYMKELYKYYLTDSDLSNEMMMYFYDSVFPLIKTNSETKIAHKSGWRGETMHDAAIVFDEYPYVVAIFTNKGFGDYVSFFNEASNLISEFHNNYWRSKANYCYNTVFKKDK